MPADESRYPCLALAREAWHRGGTCMAVLNAANEVAVEHFLGRRIGFNRIPELISEVMAATGTVPADSLEEVMRADAEARHRALQLLSTGAA